MKPWPGGLLQLLSDLAGLVDVVDLELEHRHDVAETEELLRIAKSVNAQAVS